MSENWRTAAIGGAAGASVALIFAFAAATAGWPPFMAANANAIHGYLVAHPEVLVEMSSKLQTQQDEQEDSSRQAAVNKLGLKVFFDPKIAFVTGPANAKTTVVEFFDYNCPYCRASVPTVKKFFVSHKGTRFAFIEFPIKGPGSTVAARAAVAARAQPDKYVAFHFALMSQDGPVDEQTVYDVARQNGLDVTRLKSDMKSPAIDRALAEANTLAHAANIDGTPAFIINGRIREGAMSDDVLKQMTKTS
ncbi:MAG TPA: DsbA family protein [Rhizomicrobium sp.]|jgi:protein-disulfide isomerase|nr:DsbA family protein [Rhizomicrobium sp.]